MISETHYSQPYGHIVEDDDGRFLIGIFENGEESLSIDVAGTIDFPDMVLDAPGFFVDNLAEWTSHERHGSGAWQVDGRGMYISSIPIAYGTMIRYFATLPGASHEGKASGPANLCATIVEINDDGKYSYELDVHFGDDIEDIYDFVLDDADSYYAVKRN